MTAVPIEDRVALQDLVIDFGYAVDKLTDVNDVLDTFTDDAVLDFSGVGLPVMSGKSSIKAFYAAVFAGTSHSTHYISNFRVESYDGDTATVRAYVEGLHPTNGAEVHVHVRYRMDCVRRAGAWKCIKFWVLAGMPLRDDWPSLSGPR